MATKAPKLCRYIIMPRENFEHADLANASYRPSGTRIAVAARMRATTTASPQMQVLDSIRDDAPKLVQMTQEGELSLRLSMENLQIVPEVFYHRQWQRFRVHKRPVRPKKLVKAVKGKAKAKVAAAKPAAAAAAVTVTVTDRGNGNPIRGAQIVAFTDFANRIGAQGTTGANGTARLSGISPNQKLERVYLYAPAGYWGHYAADTTGAQQSSITLPTVDVRDATLLLTQLYGALPMSAGNAVTVGIIDSGVDGKHPDLPNVSGGLNCVSDEVRANPAAAANWGPAATEGEHGTHVAGIVAGRGTTSGFRGVAPGATLRSYRVFPDAGGGASNFDIAKAIDTATLDKCDIINMSLGGGPKDDLTEAAIDRALAAGVIVIVAAGNDNRSPVSFPAAFTESVAVSAMGRVGSFPKDSIGASDIADPKGGPGGKDFIADFSNFGAEIDATGAGVDIVSTLPGDGHGPMGGTSMASPAVAGFAAYLLSANAAVRAMQGPARSRALKDLLYASCKPEGFGRDYEGFGLPLP